MLCNGTHVNLSSEIQTTMGKAIINPMFDGSARNMRPSITHFSYYSLPRNGALKNMSNLLDTSLYYVLKYRIRCVAFYGHDKNSRPGCMLVWLWNVDGRETSAVGWLKSLLVSGTVLEWQEPADLCKYSLPARQDICYNIHSLYTVTSKP